MECHLFWVRLPPFLLSVLQTVFITAEHSVCCVLHSILSLPSCRGLDYVLSLPNTWSVVFCTVFYHCRAVVAWTVFYHCRACCVLFASAVPSSHSRLAAQTVGAPLAHCPALGLDFLSSPHYVLGEGLLTGHQSNTCVRGDLLFLQTCRHFTAGSPASDSAAMGSHHPQPCRPPSYPPVLVTSGVVPALSQRAHSPFGLSASNSLK